VATEAATGIPAAAVATGGK